MKKLLILGFAVLLLAPAAAFAAGGTFTDDDTSVFEADIEWLAGAGITGGCNPPANDNYCPTRAVNRGQMAAFMRRFAGYLGAEDGQVSAADHADHATAADTAAMADDSALLNGLTAAEIVESSPLMIHAADFNPDGGGLYADHYLSWGANGWRVDATNGQCLQAPIPLPNGAALTSADIVVIDQAGNGFYAFHTAPLGDPASTVTVNGSATASATVQSVAIDLTGITASNANQNWIGVCLRSVSDILYGATVTYSITDAALAESPAVVKLGDPVREAANNGS